jgi:cytochrome c heme-lyase
MDKCPVKSDKQVEGCPVQGEKYKNPTQYNVYSQPIDVTNNMPVTPNQLQAPGQEIPLSTQRVSSGIPKGGTDEGTWTYPSPQMFWNALVRKNKVDGAKEHDMDVVVAIHNNMNENSWKQVMAWEKLHALEGNGREPKLLRFIGRPNDYSPKARLKMLFGHTKPFDRHDWIIDRGGKEVRYILDYYHDESATSKDKTPSLTDAESIQSIKVDVRPALDSFGAITDRLWRMPYVRWFTKITTGYNPPPFFPQKVTKDAEAMKKEKLATILQQINKQCADKTSKLQACESDADCAMASIALQVCSASIICPETVRDFRASLDAAPDKIDEKMGAIAECLDNFALQHRDV